MSETTMARMSLMRPGGRLLMLQSADGVENIDLYSWLEDHTQNSIEALAGITGFGLPEVQVRWFEGAGDGKTFRGSRTMPRELEMPIVIQAKDRSALNSLLSDLSRCLSPRKGLARLYFGMPDDDMWYIDIVRTGGGDWARKIDSDDERYIKTSLEFGAGDPYWTRERPEVFIMRPQNPDNTLLPYLARLRLSYGGVTGDTVISNIGDADAWPVWTLKGPFSKVTLTGPNGEILQWTGSIAETDYLIIDTKKGMVTDSTGANRYDGLSPAPRFWSVEPGRSVISVVMEDASGGLIQKGDMLSMNMATNPNGFGVGGWTYTETGHTTTWDDTVVLEPYTRSRKIVKEGTSSSQTLARVAGVGGTIPLIGDGPVTASVAVRSEMAVRATATMSWVGASGAVMGDARTIEASEIGRPYVSATPPAAATGVTVSVLVEPADGLTAVGTIATWVGGALVEPGLSPSDYFDGNSSNVGGGFHEWASVVSQSASYKYEATVVGASEAMCEWRPRRWAVA